MSMPGSPFATLRSFTRDPSVKNAAIKPGTWRRILTYAKPYRALITVFLVLLVIDAGLTVAQPLLFRKFYQVHRGDTRVAGGTGLGLYICSRLTHGMGGSIGVESAVGEGSCFILRFPCLDSSPRATRAPVKEVSL